MIMPCRNHKNQIVGLQIRKRDSLRKVRDGELEAKCVWFSSAGRENGCSSGAPVHFSCDWIWNKDHFDPYLKQKEGTRKGIAITEGFMKGDLLHMFRPDIPTIAVPGVNIIAPLKGILKELKEQGVEVVLLCFDMDYKTNPNVFKSMEDVKGIIKDAGMQVKPCNWVTTVKVDGQEIDCLKGIDDYLAYKHLGIVPKIKKMN